MTSFGLITEGFTDQAVIDNILTGFFDTIELDIRPLMPLGGETYLNQPGSFSNWKLVLRYCSSPDLEEAFQYVDYVVIQIDTDRCEEPRFGVSRYNDGIALTVEELVRAVATKLETEIGSLVWSHYQSQIIFAIAVDSIECWLLPLYADGAVKRKTMSCLKHLNRALGRKDFRTINPDGKNARYYDELSKPFRKRHELMQRRSENISLNLFVRDLTTIGQTHSDVPE